MKALEARPRLHEDLVETYDAFWSLSRPMVPGAVGPIPMTEIVAWLDLHGVDDRDERIDFAEAVHAMDVVFISHMNRKARDRTKK